MWDVEPRKKFIVELGMIHVHEWAINKTLKDYLWEGKMRLSEKLRCIYSHEKVLKLFVYSHEKV